MLEIRIMAMMRSGQHAVIDWLLNQLPGNVVYINDILHPDCDKYHHIKLCNENTDFFIFNIEDRFLAAGDEEADRMVFNHMAPKKRILIIRDPYNMFASRYARETARTNPITGELQHPEISKCSWTPLKGWTSPAAIRCWKDHAVEAIKPRITDVVINYNKWFADIEYRKTIAHGLNLNFTDKGIDKINEIGEGSSFDGVKYQDQASKMNVLSRYKRYKYDKYYTSLFDEEMKDMTHRIFQWVPEL